METRALIQRVISVEPHPDNDKLDSKLDIVHVEGGVNVANRPTPDQPRYSIGDYVVVLPENLVLPYWLLKHMDLWNPDKNKGYLADNQGNRTKARKIAGVVSDVALCKIEATSTGSAPINEGGYDRHLVRVSLVGDDYSALVLHTTRSGEDDLCGLDMTRNLEITPYVAAA